jgi:16S rRNA (guanine1207-N2)-methyltransferase
VDAAWVKKTVELTLAGRRLRFLVSQDLFSSHKVDVGTRLLLRSIVAHDLRGERLLDLGCGYGAIGVTLRALGRARSAHLVDRDALAVAFARDNAGLNAVTGVECYGSLGFDDVAAGSFDLVAINVPGKAGEPVIRHVLAGAAARATPGGHVCAVVVSALAPVARDAVVDAGSALLVDESHAGHVVLHYGPSRAGAAQSGFDAGIYDRGEASLDVAGRALALRTVYGLSEFETASFATRLLQRQLEAASPRRVAGAAMLNPGQGHVALAAAALFAPRELLLVDRDLLALRCTSRNLAAHGYASAAVHVAGFDAPGAFDLIAGVLREDEGAAAVAATVVRAAQSLAPEGLLALAGSSTAITRVESLVRARKLLRVVERDRTRGRSALLLTRR